MNYYEDINLSKDVFVIDIFEPKQNMLSFILVIGQVSHEPEEILVSGKILDPVNRVYYDEDSPRYQVNFDSYICYTV